MQWPKLCGGRNALWRHTADHGGGFLPAPTAVESTELVQWAFESRSWPKVMSTALLTRVFRQCFVEVLNKIRVGEVPDEDLLRKFLQQVSGNALLDKAVCVRPLHSLVDKVNTRNILPAARPRLHVRTCVCVLCVGMDASRRGCCIHACACVRACGCAGLEGSP